ncbi:hypothetical protein OsJ_19173 [Oryza sativa Japonica Group]|uniref:Uncharacterized protein n=1 Tax=Oryza sativa subsp. japonica TaxID=39947 RepID=B9FL33_ORYSJ|nr:hypothetical protein OsJ_19173 [Oryza sativa Japonica Group]
MPMCPRKQELTNASPSPASSVVQRVRPRRDEPLGDAVAQVDLLVASRRLDAGLRWWRLTPPRWRMSSWHRGSGGTGAACLDEPPPHTLARIASTSTADISRGPRRARLLLRGGEDEQRRQEDGAGDAPAPPPRRGRRQSPHGHGAPSWSGERERGRKKPSSRRRRRAAMAWLVAAGDDDDEMRRGRAARGRWALKAAV